MSKRQKETLERHAFDKQTKDYLEAKGEKYKVKAITNGQQELLDAIDECQWTICSGPAGSGKTHLALGRGIEYLKSNKVHKLLLIRPLQECGRQIGFLPGSKEDKLTPHMRAFADLFEKFVSPEAYQKYLREGRIEIDTCEFMRGCTFDDTYVVVDEAQNCDFKQLKMLLSRLGKNSKMVIVGDSTQCDLPSWLLYYNNEDDAKHKIDGRVPMAVMMDRLEDRDVDIAVMDLDDSDIVRNGLTAKILRWMDAK